MCTVSFLCSCDKVEGQDNYYWFIITQWIALLACSDWLLKLATASAIHLQAFVHKNCYH